MDIKTKEKRRWNKINAELQIFNNEELNLNIRAFENDDGSISVSLEDTASGLGFVTVATSGNEVVRWSRVNKYLSEFDIPSQMGEESFIPKSVFYLLAMKAKNKVAKTFQIWFATQVKRWGTHFTPPQRTNCP